MPATSVQNFTVLSLFWLCNGRESKAGYATILKRILAFLITIRQNNLHLWNPELKLDKVATSYVF